jgi:hypothetical protein
MRYINVAITDAPAVFPARYDNGAQWGTTFGGYHDPNAQQVEFQLTALDAKTPTENSTLIVYGVSWDQIKASNQLVGHPMIINGGMSAGLPLATFQSQRPKLLMETTILKAWGNWIGNETSIGFLLAPASVGSATGPVGDSSGGGSEGSSGSGGGSASPQVNRTGFRSIDRRTFPLGRPSVGTRGFAPLGMDPGAIAQMIGGMITSDADIGPATSTFGNVFSSFLGGGNANPLSAPLNIIHNLMPNMPLSGAIQETLSKAFPKANVNVAISSALKLAYQDAGMYQSLEQYTGYINKLSQSILGVKKYPGIHITSVGHVLDVWDTSTSLGNAVIDYKDLIGQPTWLDPVTISVKIVLRGGLKPGMFITLPDTVVNFSGEGSQLPMEAGASDQRSHISLPGSYQIMKVLHIGDLRNPDGASWSTNLEAVTQGSVAAQLPPESPSPPPPPPQTQTDILIRPPPGGFPQPQRMVRRYG